MYQIKIFLILLLLSKECLTHTHQLHKREREEDGAMSPRDAKHFKDGHDTVFDHEAILGSTKEAEEFDGLSPAESKRRLEILLKKMDKDSDGSISRKELHSWIMRSFKMILDEESEERMEEVDEDEDGYVTWQEYIKETFDIEDPKDLELLENSDQNDEKKLLQEDRELFNAADVNVDGRLSREEFVGFSHPEETPEMLPILLKQTLKEKDADEDGMISFQEFVGQRGKQHDKEWLVSEKERFGNEYDKDGNGVLNEKEIMNWIAPSNDEIANDEVEHLFTSADDDDDGSLDFGEVLSHYDVFVGSEVTDYGDHLENLHRFDDEL